jgi:hypothetical protein
MYWYVLACTILPDPVQGYRIPDVYTISKPSYYYDTIIRYYIGVIMCYNVL